MFGVKTLDGILKSFEKTAADLAKHIEKKAEEKLYWLEEQDFVKDTIAAIEDEVARAERVAKKVKDFIN